MRLGAEILPGKLYQRGLFYKFPLERKIEVLTAGNVGAVACLVRLPDAELQSWLWLNGGMYIYHPISDGKVIPRVLEFYASDLAQVIRKGKAVIVQCRAGRNRSGLLAALVVREITGCSGTEALEHVQRTRPNALANGYFCSYLRSLPERGSDSG